MMTGQIQKGKMKKGRMERCWMMTKEARGRRYTKEQRDRQAEEDKEATEKRGGKDDGTIKGKNKKVNFAGSCRKKRKKTGRRVKRQDD